MSKSKYTNIIKGASCFNVTQKTRCYGKAALSAHNPWRIIPGLVNYHSQMDNPRIRDLPTRDIYHYIIYPLFAIHPLTKWNDDLLNIHHVIRSLK